MATRIEKHWNREFIKSWLSIVFITLILQSFFQAIREVKLLSDSYHFSHLVRYLSVESITFMLELLPLTLFIAALNLQDEWKKKDYYLNALLDGVTLKSWRALSAYNAMKILCVWIPVWFLVVPGVAYQNTVVRLEHLHREPKIQEDKIYTIEGNTLAYIESAQENERVLDLSSQTVHSAKEYKGTIDKWKQRFLVFKVGIDKQVLWKKIGYWKESFGKERALVRSSLLRDGMYIVSILLCWVFISVDREYKMFSTKRDEENPNWTKRIVQGVLLYWGTKIMPLLARFFYPSWLLAGYAGAVALSFML